MAEGGGIKGNGEELVTPVDETALPATLERSQSVQCTGGGGMEEDTKLFAHGATLFSADNSYPLDSELKHLSFNERLDYFRKEVDERIKNLEDSLKTKSQELATITAEKRALAEKLEAEQEEKNEKVRQLKNEKVGLEKKIESLEAEVRELKNELERYVNQSRGFEEQLQKMQEQKFSTTSTPVQIPVSLQPLFEGMCKLFQEQLPPGSDQPPPSWQHAIQKASSVKDDYKNNGNSRGSGNNGVPDVCIPSQSEPRDLVEDNNNLQPEPKDQAEVLVEANNTSLTSDSNNT